ncbi:translation initiation factor eIF-2B subunit delta [Capronia coronata CBS 617.96]|uniref:Translation initiation factor eIF2B subunit delta n=1 Tax=Capronia coronata CBS 617.96 TaxID=1182541 RepID=W9XNH2_9EURO|nr:translation initiation factor eIF-2B subunit delta [Capronia coronata CBS 617.96]EXJ78506.1 translation initiation factor eIF-2B subunit delta [Capronia coronata CBS 617.96]
MADSNSSDPSAGGASLNPTAASFTMPSASDSNLTNGHAQPAPNGEGQSKVTVNSQPRTAESAGKATDPNVAEAGAGAKLTGAQLKKQKAAEKAARRAEKVAEKGAQAQVPAQTQGGPGPSGTKVEIPRRPSTTKRESDSVPQLRRTPSGSRTLPIRVGSQQQQQQQTLNSAPPEKEKHHEPKKVGMFSHLYPKEKRATLAGAGREIHPAVLALGLQLRDYVICGGNARCVATLLAFKKVIQTYTTPSGVALSRHLLTHLNHQIAYLRNARPLSTSQGNSIRWLKNLISTQPVEAADSEAKQSLCEAIDLYIRERITLADEVIAREATERIEDGDVILTYAKSSIVEKTLINAHRQGKKFKVIVVDSRPMFEGKNHARSLIRAGLRVQYALLTAIADIVDQEAVTKCFLGASAMLGNGKLLSRVGSAMVAMMAKECSKNKSRNVPVIVLCETVKFSAKAVLDSIILNELGDADALVDSAQPEVFSSTNLSGPGAAAAASKGSSKKSGSKDKDTTGKAGSKKPGGKDKDDDDPDDKGDFSNAGLEAWQDQPGLFLLNIMYDVTPADYLDLVICELGSLPPEAVPVVNGVHGDDQAIA